MDISFHRLFSMPAIEGLRTVRKYCEKRPTLKLEEIVHVIKTAEADYNSFDLDASIYLHEIIDIEVPLTGTKYYQGCIHDIVLHRQPTWAKLMMLGRTRFTKKLSRDECSLFRQAGLLDSPPTDDVITWWDNLTGRVRLAQDAEKLARARQAEKLSLNHEKKRLLDIGIDKDPEWTAIEDNTAGYDVLSYEKNEYGLINKPIEVKSTIASPLRFILTRNEWEQALKFGEVYFFHVWDLKQDPPKLYVKTLNEIAPHIPSDNEKGKWKNAEILINTN